MKKYFKYLLLFLPVFLLSAPAAQAFCPVCTVAVAAGVGLSRWLGVDDTISGLWVGAFSISVSLWTINWLKEKGWIKNFLWNIIIFIAYFVAILLPFWKTDIISFHPANMLWGVDKILLGIVIGGAVFSIGYALHLMLKENNNGKVYFPFQKIAFGVVPIIILTLVFYLLTKK